MYTNKEIPLLNLLGNQFMITQICIEITVEIIWEKLPNWNLCYQLGS